LSTRYVLLQQERFSQLSRQVELIYAPLELFELTLGPANKARKH
jgi:hypothetical protein